MEIVGSKPKQDGYSVVSAKHKHKKSILMWPERADNWRNGAKPAQKTFADLANLIIQFEPVLMLVSREQYQNARGLLDKKIQVVEMSYNDAWIRDIGPTYLLNEDGQVRTVDWRFNAWGGLVDGLYFPWDLDDQVAQKLSEFQELDYYRLNSFVFEGCAFQTDGDGTIVVTEESMLSEGRNGHITKTEIEKILTDYLGIEKIIWLKNGYFLDETNGDVDSMISFVNPGEVLLTWTDDKSDPQYEISKEAYEILSNETDAKGRKLTIHKMQIPSPLHATQEESDGVDPVNGLLPRYPGDRLTASYVNFYLINNALVLPIFNDKNDANAIVTMKELFPEREILTIDARELLLGGGNVHAIVTGIPTGFPEVK